MQRLDGLGHALEGGGHQSGQAHEPRAALAHRLHHFFGRDVPAQVQHLEAVIFQNDPHDVLADVVHVPLDGGQHDLALARAGRAVFRHRGLDLLKGGLGGAGRLQQLGQEQRALLVPRAHRVEGRDQGVVHKVQRVPAGKQRPRVGRGLPFQALLHRLHQGGVGPGGSALPGRGGCLRRGGLGRLGRHLPPGVPGDVLPALLVPPRQDAIGIDRPHHLLAGRVHDGKVEPRVHGHGQKGGVQVGPAGQPKADVGHAQHRAHPQFLLAGAQGLQRGHDVLLLGAGGQGQAVDVDVLARDAGGQGRVPDAGGNGCPLGGRLGDAPLVQGQAHHRRAVLFAQGQQLIQHRLLPVHRVDDGLAVVHPQPPLEGGGVGRIQLQRQADHALQGFHHTLHHGGLVHAGHAHIHIQDGRPALGLADGLGQDVVHVPLPDGLLEALFAGGVDPLAHHRDPVHRHILDGGAQHRGHGVGRPARLAPVKHLVQRPDKIGGGAAAAPRREQPQLPVGLHLHGEQLRGDVVAAAVRPGQAGVGLDKDGVVPRHRLAEGPRHGQDLFGAQAAVDAQSVGPEAPRGGGKAAHRAAGKGAAAGLKAHAGQHRQSAGFLAGQQGGFQLVQVGKGLAEDQVGPGLRPGPDDLGKGCHRILKGQGAGGLQQFAQRADVQSHQGAAGLRRPARAADAGGHHLGHRIPAAGQLVGRRAKSVRAEDAAARRRILRVDGFDQGGVFDVQRLGLCPQRQPRGLQHGAHGPVQQNGLACMQKFFSSHRSRLSFGIRTCPAAGSGRSRRGTRSRAPG